MYSGRSSATERRKTMRINLGSSDSLHPDFLNVDIWTPPGAVSVSSPPLVPPHFEEDEWAGRFQKADLRKRWPWADSSIDEIRAYDIFEHLPVKVHTMNEAHRVLRPGGTLDIFIPTTDGRGAFQDPTHVSFWTPNDFFYYLECFAEWKRFHEAYGITACFKVAGTDGSSIAAKIKLKTGHEQHADLVHKLKIVLEAIK